jgi:hypothetical protein
MYVHSALCPYVIFEHIPDSSEIGCAPRGLRLALFTYNIKTIGSSGLLITHLILSVMHLSVIQSRFLTAFFEA